MIVEGTLVKIDPPDYKDNYQNHYQNLVVQTATGPIRGRKASKAPYTINDLNRKVRFECEQAQNKRGPYLRFTRPQEQQYPQQAQQMQDSIDGKPDWDAIAQGKVRHGIVCAYIQSGKEPTIESVNYWTEYVMSARAPLPPSANGPAPAMSGDDEPWEH